MRTVLLSASAILLGLAPIGGFAMKSVSLEALLAATAGEAVACDTGAEFSRVEIDSRTLRAGSLFWALKGDRHDGHDFAGDALSKGAAACVVDRDRARGVAGPKICVDDTLRALHDFAAWSRRGQDALVIGVTGSVGKTTTREMLHAVLAAGYSGVCSPHNYNNHVGLPLSILNIEPAHEFAVLEMGASHVGEIRELAAVAAPEVGVVTAIGAAHIEGFGDVARVIEAKGELVEALPRSGFAVLSGDDPNVRSLADRAACPVVFVGERGNNDLQADRVNVEKQRLTFRADGAMYEIAATGRHHLTAALCAIAVAKEIGLDSRRIADGLRRFRPVAGRSRLEAIGPWEVIDDTYNASPRSMQAACELLRDWNAGGKKLLVAGDMLELGRQSAECHAQLGRLASGAGAAFLVAHGSHAAHTISGALEAGMKPHQLALCTTFESVLAVLDCWLEPGDAILVKGSRGMKMERVIDWLRVIARNSSEENTPRAQARDCA
jgi:UDP-N-acetylmuramoyl-tripeptide--D-alanyl-D-alanine ligase